MSEKRSKRSGRHASADDGDGGRRPAASAIWSGTITFGLVSVPVDLFAAVRGAHHGLRMITADGVRLRREYYCPGEGRSVAPEEIVRGAEVAKDEFVPITDEELEALAPRRSREIDLRRFVSRDDIPPIYYNRPYILAPSGGSTKAYRLLAAAMEREGRAGIATFVMRGKEYLVAILAEHGILRAETLRFPGELRSAEELPLPERPKVARKQVQRLERAIDALSAEALPVDELHDEGAQALERVVKHKQERGEDVVTPPGEEPAGEQEGAEVIDIMQVLKQRMAAPGDGDSRRRRGAAGNGGRARGRRTKSARRAEGSRRARGNSRRTRGNGGELRTKTKGELYQQAQELEIQGRSTMTKDELIDAIQTSS